MNTFESMTLAVGAVALAGAAAALLAPARTKAVLSAMPRHRALGWGLTVVALLWGMRLLWLTPLGRFEGLKPLLAVLTPVAFGLIVYAMGELLAVRALGALLVLIPVPLLSAARCHPSPWRLVAVGVAYALAVAGMTLVMAPHQLGRWIRRCAASETAWRWTAVVFGGVGLLLSALAILVY